MYTPVHMSFSSMCTPVRQRGGQHRPRRKGAAENSGALAEPRGALRRATSQTTVAAAG